MSKATNEIRRQQVARKAARLAQGYQYPDQVKVPGFRYPLEPGTRFRIRGKRGWWVFQSAEVDPDGRTAVNCSGPHPTHTHVKGASVRTFCVLEDGPPLLVSSMPWAGDIRSRITKIQRKG
jgi:hypothetical protein